MAIARTSPLIRPGGHPLLRFLTSFPIAFFFGALLTDFAYFRTANQMWADFSAWLLAVGIAMGGLAALVGIVTLIMSPAARAHRPLWPLVVGSAIVLILGFVNNLVHSRDAWTSVVPVGLILSAATVILTLITIWLSAARETRLVELDYAGVRS